MRIKSRRSVLFGAFALIAIIVLWLAPKANAATVTINKVAGTPIILPTYFSGDTLEITGDALELGDWTILRDNTTLDFHLYLNNPAMTTIDTDPAAVSIMQGNTRILSLKAPHILSIADGGDVGGVTYYGAFYSCINLESVDMPNATFIGQSAFDVCTALKSVSLPAATSIGTYAFYDCTALESVSLPAATTIGDGAFYDCRALKNVSLPAATTIGEWAFQNCIALESVSLPAATTIGKGAFYDCTVLESVSLPAATTIGQQAFHNCSALKSVSLPAATTIGNGAFYDCRALKSISLPAATSIGEWAFLNCTALESISLPAATTIGAQAFRDCTALESVSLPAATTIGDNAFQDCHALESISLPAATSIGEWAFLNCTALKSVSLPAATTIGEGAFYDCTALESVSLPAATTIGQQAFRNCSALESVSLPAATTIGGWAFAKCAALKNISLPVATNIGDSAFNNCAVLVEYVFGADPPTTLGANIGWGSNGNPTYYYDGNDAAWAGPPTFTLDATVHGANPTKTDYSATTYSLAPIAPATATIVMGNSQTFTTTLSSSTAPPTSPKIYQNWITWQLTGTNPVRSTIDALGKVTIDPDETNAMIIVTAKVVVGMKIMTRTATINVISTKCNITSFAFPNQVGASVINDAAGTIAVTMPHGTNVTALSPTIAVSNFAMIAPLSGAAQDFTNPVNYIVTAQDGVTTGTYAVTVTLGTAPAITPPPTTTTTSTTPANYVYNFAQLPTVENNYTAIVNIDFSQFTGVYVDGSLLSSDKYTAQSGSTIVRLNESFINTLSTGEHTIGLSFSDGLASGTFNVAGANSGILGIGVYPFEGGMQPYTPSVTPSIRAIEEEKLDEGVFEQEIFDEAETSQSPTLMLVIAGAIVALGAGIMINRRRKNV